MFISINKSLPNEIREHWNSSLLSTKPHKNNRHAPSCFVSTEGSTARIQQAAWTAECAARGAESRTRNDLYSLHPLPPHTRFDANQELYCAKKGVCGAVWLARGSHNPEVASSSLVIRKVKKAPIIFATDWMTDCLISGPDDGDWGCRACCV